MKLPKTDARVIARLDADEQALLRRARELTGKNTSAVIKAALRQYVASLPDVSPIGIFRERGVIGAASGPTDLSEKYKDRLDYAAKHGR